MATASSSSSSSSKSVTIERLAVRNALVQIEGTTPLIVNKFSEKARQQMLDAQQGRKSAKLAKDPEALFLASIYRLPDNSCGFPATGFKAAIVGAGRHFHGVTMTALRQAVFLPGEGPDMLVRIEGEPAMREDAVRNANGGTDLRFRAQFWPWSTTLNVTYLPTLLPDLSSLVALIDAAGLGGIGEWRPNKSATGSFGMFRVKDATEQAAQ